MEYYNMLLPLAIILIVSKLLAKACTKFNLPTVVGLLVTGLLMSLIRYMRWTESAFSPRSASYSSCLRPDLRPMSSSCATSA